MNRYAEEAMREMVGNVDPWPPRTWFEELGQTMEAEADQIKTDLLSKHPSLTSEKAQRIADQEVMFRHVGIPILGWPEPQPQDDPEPIDPNDPVDSRYLDDTTAHLTKAWEKAQHEAS